jgi:hypothetical protein
MPVSREIGCIRRPSTLRPRRAGQLATCPAKGERVAHRPARSAGRRTRSLGGRNPWRHRRGPSGQTPDAAGGLWVVCPTPEGKAEPVRGFGSIPRAAALERAYGTTEGTTPRRETPGAEPGWNKPGRRCGEQSVERVRNPEGATRPVGWVPPECVAPQRWQDAEGERTSDGARCAAPCFWHGRSSRRVIV